MKFIRPNIGSVAGVTIFTCGMVILGAVISVFLHDTWTVKQPTVETAKPSIATDDVPKIVVLTALDNRALEDSRELELSGLTGSGITAVEIWSSCDDDTYRIKKFKPGDSNFTYRISPSLGNVCRGQNDFIVKTYGGSGTTRVWEYKQTLFSAVGVRSRSEFQLLRFLDAHTLSSTQSIEDQAVMPINVPMPADFESMCMKKDVDALRSVSTVRINDNLTARFNFILAKDVNQNPQAQLLFLERRNEGYFPSSIIPPFPLGGCAAKQNPMLYQISDQRIAIVTNGGLGYASILDGPRWISLRDLLSQHVPLLQANGGIGNVRTIVYGDTIGIVETDETRLNDYSGESDAFPDQRGEYLFSTNDLSFKGVVWHRKR